MPIQLTGVLLCAVMVVSPAMGGTVLWLTADEGEPGAPAASPVDSGDYSLTATGAGGVVYSSDVAGIGAASSPHERSFSFNGVDALIRVTDNAALNLTGDYTIEFFMKLTGEYTLDAFWPLFERKTDTQQYSMYADPLNYHEFLTYLVGSAGGGGFGGTNSLPAQGEWHHVALVYDSSNVDREANLYVDGVWKTGRNFAATGQGTNFSMIADLLFGHGSYYQFTDLWLEGLLDEIRITDMALDPSEFLDVVVPVAPEITELDGAPLLVKVGTDVVFTASFTDDPGDTHVATWDFGDGDILVTDPAFSPETATHAYAEAGTYTVELTITDAGGLSDTETIVVVVYAPVPPEITDLDGAPLLVEVGSDVVLTASFSDDDVGDTHVATWDFGDGNALVTDPALSPETATHAYVDAGIYTVELTITDADGLSDTESIVVVAYDPSAGFTTGGGWFIPDAESFIDGTPVTDTTSKANFGFMVKYKKGASTPDGNLEFVYKAGDINLHGTDTEWLVIQSATKVRFKGEATINGEGLYTYKVTAEDNGELGTSDTFKIEIWIGVVDTENDPPEPKHKAQGVLGGGNIKIHQN